MIASFAFPRQKRRDLRSLLDRRALPIYGLAVALCVIAMLGFAVTDLQLAVKEFVPTAIIAGLLLLSAWSLRGRGFVKTATVIEAWTLWVAISLVYALISFVLGAGHWPFADGWLATTDRLIAPFFDWPSAMLAFSHAGPALVLANFAYSSILWQPSVLLLALAITGASPKSWTVLLAWLTTLGIVIAIFAFCPGLGAYSHFGISAADVPGMRDPIPWRQPEILLGLRDGSLRMIHLSTLDGIVTFPSFHAAAAVLLAWGFSHARWFRWPFALLNGVMLISAIPIGGHYLTDIVAGVLVAGLGIAIAGEIERRFALPDPNAAA